MQERYRVSDAICALILPRFPQRDPQNEARQQLFLRPLFLRPVNRWPGDCSRHPLIIGIQFLLQFNRYSKDDVWERIFEDLKPKHVQELLVDSTSIKAHRHARGGAYKRSFNT